MNETKKPKTSPRSRRADVAPPAQVPARVEQPKLAPRDRRTPAGGQEGGLDAPPGDLR